MGVLLVAAATSSLLLISVLQVPLLASAAAFPRPPKIGSYLSPATSQKIKQNLKNLFKKHGDDVADVAQNLLPPPGAGSGGGGRTATDSAPANTDGLYVATLCVGSPRQRISGVVDISTQLVWMQCASCTTCLPPPASSFNLTASATAVQLRCDSDTCQKLATRMTCTESEPLCGYVAEYSNNASTEGYLVNDTFTFDTTPVDGMLFGCSDTSTGDYSGASGVFGLGRGPLSLVSQLELSNFSYVLPLDNGSDNEIELGGVTVPRTGRSTPLDSSNAYPDLYYVRLKGVLVDGQEVDGIPAGTFDLQKDGSGGVYLSTTVPVTYLLSDAYSVVREAFARKISPQPLSNGSLDSLCYKAESMNDVDVPVLALVFHGVDGGGDVTMELSKANYFVEVNDGEGDDLQCLAVLPSEGASLLGSLLQMGTKMIYDLEHEQLTFVTSPSQESLASKAPAASLVMAVGAVAVWVLQLLI